MIDTSIEWPKGLPVPLTEENTASPVSPFIRTEKENGRARMRRKFTAVPVPTTWSIVCNNQQAAFFERWFQDVLVDGTQWFKLKKATPLGFNLLVCQFKTMYSRSRYGANLWKYSATIELFERDLMPREWLEFPDLWLGMNIIDIAVNDKWPAAS